MHAQDMKNASVAELRKTPMMSGFQAAGVSLEAHESYVYRTQKCKKEVSR